MDAGQRTQAGIAVVDDRHAGKVMPAGPTGDDRLDDDRSEPAGEVLDERSVTRRQTGLVATHAAAQAAGQNHETAAAAHGKSLRRRLLPDSAADVAEDVRDLVAQQDQDDDHDHRDQDQDQGVLDHRLALLLVDHMRKPPPDEFNEMHDGIVRAGPCAIRYRTVAPGVQNTYKKTGPGRSFSFCAGSGLRGKWRLMPRPRSTGRWT